MNGGILLGFPLQAQGFQVQNHQAQNHQVPNHQAPQMKVPKSPHSDIEKNGIQRELPPQRLRQPIENHRSNFPKTKLT